MADENTTQNTFDWMDDNNSMEVVEGIKFDPEIDYPFEIKEIVGKKGVKEGHEWQAIEVHFAEQESGVVIRKSFFVSPKITKNMDTPAKSNDLVKLAEALGHKPSIGSKIHPKNFLRVGLKITAKVVPSKNKEGKETGYSEIDLTTVRPSGTKAQQKITIDPVKIEKWQKEITDGKYTSKEKYLQNLANTGRVMEVSEFLAAADSGSIKF